ncbi:MAG: hypothetical protein ACP5N2_01860 [Candidatus Nanoarchaeia archaeon]
MNNIKNLSIDELYDAKAIMNAAKSTVQNNQLSLDFNGTKSDVRTTSEYYHITKTHDIFSSALDFVKKEGKNGGIMEVVRKYMDDPLEYRKHMVKNVMHMGDKLASMWYLCLGGDDSILTLDRHVCRQLVNLGVELNSKYSLGNVRSTGRAGKRKIVETLTGKKYAAVESHALALLEQHNVGEDYSAFMIGDHLHGGLITTLFWWQGVKHHRKYGLNPITDENKLRLLFKTKYSEKQHSEK